VNETLGLSLSIRDAAKALRRMRHRVKIVNRSLIVKPPPYRADIMHPIDLVEDIAMGIRYWMLEPKQPETITYGKLHPDTILEETVRDILLGLEYTEVMNFTLTNEEDEYVRMGVDPHPHIVLMNPVSAEYSILRTWILPSLMKTLSYNRGSLYPQRIFEIGDVIHPKEDAPERAIRMLRLGAATCHANASYSEIKSVMEEILKNLMVEGWRLEPFDSMPFMEGRAAKIIWNGKQIGFLGEIHPEVLTRWDLAMPTSALELDLSILKARSS